MITQEFPDILDDDIPEGFDEEEIDPLGTIVSPFDPTQIRVDRKTPTIDLLTDRIQHGEINLAPDFQRKGGIWNNDAKSRLIESILIRIPLPAFYVDATDENLWLVVDGLQRLTTLKNFVVDGTHELSGLEFITELNGKKFADLPRNLQRRIKETEVTVFLIQPGTPPEVKFNIFKRINTGGMPLSTQEIRNAINGERVRNFVKALVDSPSFQTATGGKIGDKRMADRECVCRFLAFEIVPPSEYQGKDLDSFINRSMQKINDPDECPENTLRELGQLFDKTMKRANRLFGKFAFRKYHGPGRRMMPISKALFESVSHGLARLTDEEAEHLIRHRKAVLEAYGQLMADKEFEKSVSQATGDAGQVKRRFSKIIGLFQSFNTP